MREAEAAASPAAPRVSIPVGPPAVLPVQNPWPAAIAWAAGLPAPSWTAALRPAIAPMTPGAGAVMGGGSALANAFAPSCVTGPTPWQPAVLPFQNPWPAAIACAAALPTPSWAAALRPAIAPMTPGAGAVMGGGSALARAFAPSCVSGSTPWPPAVLPFQNPWPAAIARAAALPALSWAAALRPAIAPVTPGAGAVMGGGSTLARAFAPSGVSCLPLPLPPLLPPPPALPSASASLAACPSAVPKACGDLADGARPQDGKRGVDLTWSPLA